MMRLQWQFIPCDFGNIFVDLQVLNKSKRKMEMARSEPSFLENC